MGRVLVIDDEKNITAIIQETLSLCGFDVHTAADGGEGIQKFNSQRFDVVITDIMMPNIDGNSVARFIRDSDRKETPIIGMSGTPLLLSDDSFDDVLLKPFTLQNLINTVKSLPLLSSAARAVA